MNNKNGYLLLEVIIALSIISTILLVLCSVLFFCLKSQSKIEDKIEIQQQSVEISKHIKSNIEKSRGIISVKFDGVEENNEEEIIYKSISSIKLKYKSDNITNIKNKEISFKRNTNKIFINTLNNSNQSESGGYEIGDYVDNIYVGEVENKEFLNVKLKLKKNDQIYENKFKIYIRNYEGGI